MAEVRTHVQDLVDVRTVARIDAIHVSVDPSGTSDVRLEVDGRPLADVDPIWYLDTPAYTGVGDMTSDDLAFAAQEWRSLLISALLLRDQGWQLGVPRPQSVGDVWSQNGIAVNVLRTLGWQVVRDTSDLPARFEVAVTPRRWFLAGAPPVIFERMDTLVELLNRTWSWARSRRLLCLTVQFGLSEEAEFIATGLHVGIPSECSQQQLTVIAQDGLP